jgi:hypothetical protein
MQSGTYHSSDGVTSGVLTEENKHFLELNGYEVYIAVQGTCYSELAMHCRLTNKKGVHAFVKDISNPYYAYILFDDGTLCGGCFRRYNDGTFSIA